MKASRVFALTIFLLLLSAATAEACTCAAPPSPAEAFNAATAVFVGRVVGMEEKEAQAAVALVEEAFKGARVGGEIVLTQPNNTCTPTFDAGKRYLFYANYEKKSKKWTVYGCGRGPDLELLADDLMYLRALPSSAERNRVSGMLRHYEDGPEKGFALVEHVAGAKVKIKGKDKTYEVATDSNGVYELYDLPPGRYTIEPELPFGLKVRFPVRFGPGEEGDGVTVELTEKTCAGADFLVSSDNVIGGRVFGPGGAPLAGVCLELLAAGKVEPFGGGGRIFGCADEEGRYKLEQVPPGRYFIVANGWNRISGNTPFPLTYYPGAFEKDKASVVTVVGRGDIRTDYDVTVPKLLPTVTVSGVVVFSDGRPAARVAVAFQPLTARDAYEGRESAVTDEAGRFSLRLLRGVPGKLRGEFGAYEGTFEKTCPAIRRLIESNNGRGTAATPRVAVDAEGDADDLRLAFSVPFCPPKKREDDKR
ncbi:MAG TPA: hypothetical protein VM914_14355 [Pyrinomonadaceae bacterium]|nr:hypothetical protein [Pyrinomonadaceae bacterium]